VKECIKIACLLSLLLITSFASAKEEEFSDTVVSTEEFIKEKAAKTVDWKEDYITKRKFDNETYNELKKEVELVEEIAKRKLNSDSSDFGKGYGVEYGKDYYVWDFDSVNDGVNVGEEDRRSGGDFRDDGIRDNGLDRQGYLRDDTRRTENKRRHGKVGKESQRIKRDQNKSASGRDGDIGSFFFILFVAIIVGAIVYFIFINSPIEGSSTKIDYTKDIDPTKVKLSELELKIKLAEESGEYRVATRYYFIWVMKELSDCAHIIWKKKKTNYHYISEVADKGFNKDFSRIVNIFEYVWYGKYEIKLGEYNSVKKEFRVLIDKLTSGTRK